MTRTGDHSAAKVPCVKCARKVSVFVGGGCVRCWIDGAPARQGSGVAGAKGAGKTGTAR
jgi:hypothetical protein